MEYGSYHAIVACTAAGSGIALVPRSVLRLAGAEAQVAVHPLPPKVAHARTMLVWRRATSRARSRRCARNWIEDLRRRLHLRSAQGEADHRRNRFLAGGILEIGEAQRLESFTAFEDFLARPGPWIGGFDFPFSLPRELRDSRLAAGLASAGGALRGHD